MRYFYLVLLLVYYESVNAIDIDPPTGVGYDNPIVSDEVWGDVSGVNDSTYVLNADYSISNAQTSGFVTVNVYGNLSDVSGQYKLVVGAEGDSYPATLIVYGNLTLENSQSKLYGNVIVTGTTTLKNSDVLGSANLITLGDLIVESGGATVTGQIFPIPPSVQLDKNGNPVGTISTSTVEELIAEMTDGTELGDILADLIESIPQVEGAISDGTNKTWNGSTNEVWTEVNNWVDQLNPININNVITIDNGANYPVYTGNLQCYKLIMNAESELSITGNLTLSGDLILNEGSNLYVDGNLSVSGDITLNNSTTTPASLSVTGAITGNAILNWESMEGDRWWYMGHPLSNSGVNLFDYYDASVGTTVSNDFRLYYWSGSTQSWSRISDNTYSFNPLEGYAFIAMNNPSTLSYEGDFNSNTSYSISSTGAGWHHFANPYPSYIQINHGDNSFGNFTLGYKVYTSNGGSRAWQGYYWGGTPAEFPIADGTQYIAPGQGFWMYTTSASDGIIISKTSCVSISTAESAGSVSLKSTTSSSYPYLIMSLDNDVSKGEMYLLFDKDGSDLFTRHDFKKKFVGGNVADMYMVKDDVYVDINVLPTITSSVIVPVGYKVSANGMTEMTINTSDVSFIDEAYDVFLDDLQEPSVSINLRKQSSYTFTPEVAQTDGRFQLRIVPSMTTGVDDEEDVVSDESVSVYTLKQTATVVVTDEVYT